MTAERLAELVAKCERLHVRLDELRGELAEIRARLDAVDVGLGGIVFDSSRAECIVHSNAIRVCELGARGCLARHGGAR
jgi:hypothetical protein